MTRPIGKPRSTRTASDSCSELSSVSGHRVGGSGLVEFGGVGGIAGADDDRQIGMARPQLLHHAHDQYRFVHRQDHCARIVQDQAVRSRFRCRRCRTGPAIRRCARRLTMAGSVSMPSQDAPWTESMSATSLPTRPKPMTTTRSPSGSSTATACPASAPPLATRRPQVSPTLASSGVMVRPMAVTICQNCAVSRSIREASAARCEHDQRGFRRACHQDAGFQRGCPLLAHRAQGEHRDQRLEHHNPGHRQREWPDLLPDNAQVDGPCRW